MNEKENNPKWASAYQIIKDGLMLSPENKPLKTFTTLKKYMQMQKSYHHRKNPRGIETHYISMKDIDNWNKTILKNQYVANKLP